MITAGTPVVSAAGITASVAGPTPNQPETPFASVDDAVRWRQAQLWFDPAFDRAKPHAASAVAVADASRGFALLDLDSSLRIGSGARDSVPVATWSPLDERVLAVVDGAGARLGTGGASDAMTGALLATRRGAPPAVTVTGANVGEHLTDAAGGLDRFRPSARTAALIAVGTLGVGAAIGAVALATRD